MRNDPAKRAEIYAQQVDRLFKGALGLSYSYVRDDLERSPVAPRLEEAIHHDLDPAEFARRVANQFGLKGTDRPDAVPMNRRIAALAAYSAENPGWTPGRDGALYREGPVGVERLLPGRSPDGRAFGFVVERSQDGAIEIDDGEIVSMTGHFHKVAGGLDIRDAIDRLETAYDSGMRM